MQATFRFLPYILEEVGVDQVRQISIKGFNSPSLPIYNYIAPKEVEIYQKNKGNLKEVEESKEEWSWLLKLFFFDNFEDKL